jgi:hypothetical protein
VADFRVSLIVSIFGIGDLVLDAEVEREDFDGVHN